MSEIGKQRVFRLRPIVKHADAPAWGLSYLPPTVLWVHAESTDEARRLVAVTTAREGTKQDIALRDSPWISKTLVECVEDKPSRTPSRGFVQLTSGTEVAFPKCYRKQIKESN